MRRSQRIVFSLAAVSWMAVAANVKGNIVIDFTENTATNQTMVQVTGSLDTAMFGTPTFLSSVGGVAAIGPIGGNVQLSYFGAAHDYYPMAQPFIAPFGPGFSSFGTFLGPDPFYIDSNGSFADQLALPGNYVSGSPLNSAGAFNGNFASLGINTNPVVMNLPGSQTISLQFSSVPEPAAGLLVLIGSACISLRRRR